MPPSPARASEKHQRAEDDQSALEEPAAKRQKDGFSPSGPDGFAVGAGTSPSTRLRKRSKSKGSPSQPQALQGGTGGGGDGLVFLSAAQAADPAGGRASAGDSSQQEGLHPEEARPERSGEEPRGGGFLEQGQFLHEGPRHGASSAASGAKSGGLQAKYGSAGKSELARAVQGGGAAGGLRKKCTPPPQIATDGLDGRGSPGSSPLRSASSNSSGTSSRLTRFGSRAAREGKENEGGLLPLGKQGRLVQIVKKSSPGKKGGPQEGAGADWRVAQLWESESLGGGGRR